MTTFMFAHVTIQVTRLLPYTKWISPPGFKCLKQIISERSSCTYRETHHVMFQSGTVRVSGFSSIESLRSLSLVRK